MCLLTSVFTVMPMYFPDKHQVAPFVAVTVVFGIGLLCTAQTFSKLYLLCLNKMVGSYIFFKFSISINFESFVSKAFTIVTYSFHSMILTLDVSAGTGYLSLRLVNQSNHLLLN